MKRKLILVFALDIEDDGVTDREMVIAAEARYRLHSDDWSWPDEKPIAFGFRDGPNLRSLHTLNGTMTIQEIVDAIHKND